MMTTARVESMMIALQGAGKLSYLPSQEAKISTELAQEAKISTELAKFKYLELPFDTNKLS